MPPRKSNYLIFHFIYYIELEQRPPWFKSRSKKPPFCTAWWAHPLSPTTLNLYQPYPEFHLNSVSVGGRHSCRSLMWFNCRKTFLDVSRKEIRIMVSTPATVTAYYRKSVKVGSYSKIMLFQVWSPIKVSHPLLNLQLLVALANMKQSGCYECRYTKIKTPHTLKSELRDRCQQA